MTGLWAIQNRVQTTSPGGYRPTWGGQGTGIGTGKAGNGYGGLAGAGFWMQIGGAFLGAVGTYYEAKARQSELKSQALSMDFEQSMAAINARRMEVEAESILQAGRQQVGLSGLQWAQTRGANRARTGARGVQAGVGSAAEVTASIDYAAEVDKLTISANAVRAAGNARMGAVDQRNRGLLAGVSASNLRMTARGINPLSMAHTSLLASSGSALRQGSYLSRY